MSTTTFPLTSTLCTHLCVAHHLAHPGRLLHGRLAIQFGEQCVSCWPRMDPLPVTVRVGPLGAQAHWLILPADRYPMQRHSQGTMQVQHHSLY